MQDKDYLNNKIIKLLPLKSTNNQIGSDFLFRTHIKSSIYEPILSDYIVLVEVN